MDHSASDISEQSAATRGGYDGAYIAHLWEYPTLCVAIFGVQFHTPEGQRRYGESGISEEMTPALEAAQAEGHLLTRRVMEGETSALLLQYWRSYGELDRWARTLPHMRWWRWLLENAGEDISFYHEIYQVKAAEAVYEKGCLPVGPAAFATTAAVEAGEGQSKQRQRRFSEAADAAGA
jgi:hypothetical protein